MFKKIVSSALIALFLIQALAVFAFAGNDKPVWYETDETGDFYGAAVPGIADFAGSLSAAEKADLSEKISKIIEKYNYDVLIITDKSTYGLEDREYVSEYYDNYGYGKGENSSGFLLFVNEDPADTYWYFYARGDCAPYCTDENTDTLYYKAVDYADDRYSQFKEYLIALDALFSGTDSAKNQNRPDWYPEDVNGFVDFHGENLPRVVDNADIYTDEEEAELTAKINALISKFGDKYDFVIFTDTSAYGLGMNIYPADFYQFNGYGKGEDYSGSVYFVCMDPNDRYWYSAACGASRSYFTEANVNAIDDAIEPYMISHDFAGAAFEYIERLDELYETGKITKKITFFDYIPIFIVAGIIAAIIAGIISGSEKKKMKSVATAVSAGAYSASFDLKSMDEVFLYKTVDKKYSPPPPPSSSSGTRSSGGSTYHSSYHSSGGRSFSGGGRRF